LSSIGLAITMVNFEKLYQIERSILQYSCAKYIDIKSMNQQLRIHLDIPVWF